VSTTTRPNYVQPALIGGVVMGVLSALPIVNVGNVCCCLWVVSGGAIAAFIFQQNQTSPIRPEDGALVGLLAGLIGAVVEVLVAIPVNILVTPMKLAMVQRVMNMGGFPPEVRDFMEQYGQGGGMGGAFFFVIVTILGLMFWVVVGGIFSTLGGFIGALIFRKRTPPGTIDVTPQA
jgi:hypothetical protein